jgi:glycosyltransferase involved in cell wall biosynthesis
VNRSRLSILHVDTGCEYRGGQRQVEMLLRGLVERGHRVGLAVPPEAPLAARLADESRVGIYPIAFRGELSLSTALALRTQLKAGGFRILHTHTAHAITPAHWARAGRPVALIAHRRVDFPLRRNPFAQWKSRWPDAWIAVSEGVRRQLVRDGLKAQRIAVVESAIDPGRLIATRDRNDVRREFGASESEPIIVTVGELATHKGHTDLITAIRACDGVAAWIVGEGDRRGSLQSQIDRSGLGMRIQLLGMRNDIADLLSACDVFVFPSISGEGSPAALKEAMALGLPIVASDIPAHRDLGLPEGSLYPPGDSAGLRQSLVGVLRDLNQARALAQSRTGDIARFLPERLIARTEAVYQAVLAGGSVGQALSLESPPA